MRIGRRGATALEFGLLCPVIFFFLFGILGIGVLGIVQQVVDNGVRDAARQIQINGYSLNESAFRTALCKSISVVVDQAWCTANVSYKITQSSGPAGFSTMSPSPVTGSAMLGRVYPAAAGVAIPPNTASPVFSPNINVLVQVCLPLQLTLPLNGGLFAGDSQPCIYGIAAVRVEPYA